MPVKIFYPIVVVIILLPLQGTSQYIPPVVEKPVPVYTPKDYKGYTPPPKEIKYNPPPAIRETKSVNNTPAYTNPSDNNPKTISNDTYYNLRNVKHKTRGVALNSWSSIKTMGYELNLPELPGYIYVYFFSLSELPNWNKDIIHTWKIYTVDTVSYRSYLFDGGEYSLLWRKNNIQDLDYLLKGIEDQVREKNGIKKIVPKTAYTTESIKYEKYDFLIYEYNPRWGGDINQKQYDFIKHTGYKLNISYKDSALVAVLISNDRPGWLIRIVDKLSTVGISYYVALNYSVISFNNNIDADLKLIEDAVLLKLGKSKNTVVTKDAPGIIKEEKVVGYYPNSGLYSYTGNSSLYKKEVFLFDLVTMQEKADGYKLNIPAKDSVFVARYRGYTGKPGWSIFLIDKKRFPNSDECKMFSDVNSIFLNMIYSLQSSFSFKNNIDSDLKLLENELLLKLGKSKNKTVKPNTGNTNTQSAKLNKTN